MPGYKDFVMSTEEFGQTKSVANVKKHSNMKTLDDVEFKLVMDQPDAWVVLKRYKDGKTPCKCLVLLLAKAQYYIIEYNKVPKAYMNADGSVKETDEDGKPVDLMSVLTEKSRQILGLKVGTEEYCDEDGVTVRTRKVVSFDKKKAAEQLGTFFKEVEPGENKPGIRLGKGYFDKFHTSQPWRERFVNTIMCGGENDMQFDVDEDGDEIEGTRHYVPNAKFLYLIRQGLMTVSLWVDKIMGGAESRRGYYGRDYSRFNGVSWWDSVTDNPDIVKTMKYIREKAGGDPELEHAATLRGRLEGLYNTETYRAADHMNTDAIGAFIVLCNVYRKVPTRFIDAYMADPSLRGLSPTVGGVFVRRSDATTNTNSYGRYGYGYGNSNDIARMTDAHEVEALRKAGNLIQYGEDEFLDFLFCESKNQGMGRSLSEWCSTWADTIHMQIFQEVPDRKLVKYSRAPSRGRPVVRTMGLKPFHDRLVDVNTVLEEAGMADSRMWKAAHDRGSVFNETYKDWTLRCPESKQELVDLSMEQANCVKRVYVQSVANGTTNILGLYRGKGEDEELVCTVEITNSGDAVQFFGYNDRHVTRDEAEVLLKLMEKNRRRRGLRVAPQVPRTAYFSMSTSSYVRQYDDRISGYSGDVKAEAVSDD